MEALSPLEQAVLDAIALQVPKVADTLAGEQVNVRVTARKNTGAGFYTTLDVSHRLPNEGVTSPLGDVGATIVGLHHGMGFMLWLQDGRIHRLEVSHTKRTRVISISSAWRSGWSVRVSDEGGVLGDLGALDGFKIKLGTKIARIDAAIHCSRTVDARQRNRRLLV
jgi:hypothetical protein